MLFFFKILCIYSSTPALLHALNTMAPLTSSQTELLKWIGLFAMTADHIAIILNPSYFQELSILLRIIGRSAFLIFGFIIAANLARPEVDVKKYLIRMLGWACIAQIAYQWVFAQSLYTIEELNILFQFFAVITFIYAGQMLFKPQLTYKIIGIIAALLAFCVAYVSDYDLRGLIYCVSSYIYIKVAKTPHQQLCGAGVLIAIAIAQNASMLSAYFGSSLFILPIIVISFTVLLLTYPEKFISIPSLSIPRPRSTIFKNFFYMYYPLHLIVLKLLSTFIR
ncbi:hypothetical protein FXB91_04565 [Aggregatibacter actinomycetemcomitans]|nr:hypothetical protein FXB91_04565 [Aggregatibacter actinomycetemcomitans]